MPLKVFYFDDEVDLLALFRELFNSSDVEVSTFSDVQTLMVEIQNSPPDLLVVDYRLKGTTGDKVAIEIRARFPMQFPIALLTGDLNIQTKFHFLQQIEKPYKQNVILELFASVRKLRLSRSA